MMYMVVCMVMVGLVSGSEDTHRQCPLVTTQQGVVSGVQDVAIGGRIFNAYYSIPFAKPPVGPLRFKVPEPMPAWEGVLEGRQQPTPCIHIPFTSILRGQTPIIGQEDCLYLNVFTPKVDPGAGLPVLVFIHGGGYFSGQADSFHPYALLDHDIVLVTLQYRLGFLGFLSTEDEALPGNLGLHDQLMALRWVQENIRAFGGDPTSVTISGHSAGGSSAHLLMLSPKSEGLIHGAILQSGNGLCTWSVYNDHRQAAWELARLVGCAQQTTPSTQLVQCLRGVEAKTLVEKLITFMDWQVFPMVNTPRVDGDLLPFPPETLARMASYKKIPILSGYTSHDGAIFALPLYTREELRTNLTAYFSTLGPISLSLNSANKDPAHLADQIFHHYLGGVNLRRETADELVQMFTDNYFRICQDEATLQHAAAVPGQAYAYILDYRGQRSLTDPYNITFSRHWVTHGDELFYLYASDPDWRFLTSPDDIKLRTIITKLWANFAKTGNPTPDDSLGVQWQASNATHLHYLALSPSPTMIHETGRQKQAREFWSSLPTRHNTLLRGDVHVSSAPPLDLNPEEFNIEEDTGFPRESGWKLDL